MAEKEYVEREEVLKYADWLGEHDGYGWQDVQTVRTTTIKNLPAADVATVRHGRWETDTCHVYCSVCDKHADYKTNFCPHCGADMRKYDP